MRDYALNRAAAAESAGSLSLLWGVIRNWRARRSVARLDALDEARARNALAVVQSIVRLTKASAFKWSTPESLGAKRQNTRSTGWLSTAS